MKTLNLTIPGLTIACKIWGTANNPPIVALHGWLDNANSFDPLAKLLQEDYYLIAVDLPGHGHSSHLPLGSNYHFVDAIFVVLQILDALNIEKAHLLGHSMGACLASMVAGVAPDRLLSLNLIEGLGPLTHPADTTCQQLTNYMHYLYQQNNKPAKGYSSLEHAAKARSMKGYVSQEIANKLVERGITEKEDGFFWRHDRRLQAHSPLRMTEQQVLSCLKEIKTKALLIWASNGFAFDSELMQQRINALAHIRIEHLEGGHHVHMEQPSVVVRILREFLL